MAPIQWREEFKTGFPSIDYEHENLISAINGLLGKIAEDCPVEDIDEGLGEINALVEAHFALEEKLMRDMAYGEYAAHKADHDRLLEVIRDIMDGIHENPDADFKATLAHQLSQWFTDHFATMDTRLHTAASG